MSRNNKSFLFLGDALSLENEPVEIIENHFLKKANSSQIDIIKKSMGNEEINQYTVFIKYENEKKGNSIVKLEEKDWKYWIIEYNGTQINDHIKTAIMLSKLDLNPLFEIIYHHDAYGPGKLYNPYHLYNFLADNVHDFSIKKVDRIDIDEISDIFNLINHFIPMSDNYKYIYKSLSDFNDLKLINKRSSLKFVALFSIIESLIANTQRDSKNTITFQLMTKLELLNNNAFKNKIDFRQFFNGSDTLSFKTIIKFLYNYRSDIAHGDYTDFQSDLQVIRDLSQSYNFLYLLLKELIIYSLNNPQLINDIKNC